MFWKFRMILKDQRNFRVLSFSAAWGTRKRSKLQNLQFCAKESTHVLFSHYKVSLNMALYYSLYLQKNRDNVEESWFTTHFPCSCHSIWTYLDQCRTGQTCPSSFSATFPSHAVDSFRGVQTVKQCHNVAVGCCEAPTMHTGSVVSTYFNSQHMWKYLWKILKYLCWLVVWLPLFEFSHILGIIIPIDQYFSEGWPNHQPALIL